MSAAVPSPANAAAAAARTAAAVPAPAVVVASVLDAARAWRDQDPDDTTRAELDALLVAAESTADSTGSTAEPAAAAEISAAAAASAEITAASAASAASATNASAAAALAELTARFSSRLAFGTAGLRGPLGAGSNRMNRVLVAQAAAGFAAYLLSREKTPSIVIGYDGRTNSHVFATDTAEIMAGAGVHAILLPRLLPTPVLAFAVRHLGASAGVMVTASHNPGADNGYKVYLGGLDHGSQIVAPADAEIAAFIDRAATVRVQDFPRSSEYDTADEDLLDDYVQLTADVALKARDAEAPVAQVAVVYTAMHGVGWETARRVFVAAGFEEPAVVVEQIEPDAAFPTVAFPNPEEPGALDLSFARASELGAELIIANDPDADRLAIAIPVPANLPGGTGATDLAAGPVGAVTDGAATGWRRLSGNEVGMLLGWRAAERLQFSDTSGTLAASIVSSPALRQIALKYRLDYVDTLTGFKWISRVGGLGYGYEEALGYLVDPAKVRDKDGISAAVDFLGLVSELKASGKTLDDHMNDFATRFGAFASSQISLRVTELSDIPRIMAGLRDKPPAAIGGTRVESIDDFRDGFGPFPPSDILRIWLEGGARIVVRPSGTEPKLKVYIDASADEGTGPERRAAAEAVVATLDKGMRDLIGG